MIQLPGRSFIVTLALEPSAELRLTELRQRHFPPERNYLTAHVTLFHALPESERLRWQVDLERAVAETTAFPIALGPPYSLGRGVAFRADAQALANLRNGLRMKWVDFLGRQDLQGYRPHCTVQNKVEPSVARETLAVLAASWQPLETYAEGARLWEYQGGPWRLEAELRFAVPASR